MPASCNKILWHQFSLTLTQRNFKVFDPCFASAVACFILTAGPVAAQFGVIPLKSRPFGSVSAFRNLCEKPHGQTERASASGGWGRHLESRMLPSSNPQNLKNFCTVLSREGIKPKVIAYQAPGRKVCFFLRQLQGFPDYICWQMFLDNLHKHLMDLFVCLFLFILTIHTSIEIRKFAFIGHTSKA